MADLLNIEDNNNSGHFIIDVDVVEPRDEEEVVMEEEEEEEEVDDTGVAVVTTTGVNTAGAGAVTMPAGAVAANTAGAGAFTAAGATGDMAVTTAGAGAVNTAGSSAVNTAGAGAVTSTGGGVAVNTAGAGAVTSTAGGAAMITAGAGAVTTTGATVTGRVNTAGAGSVNSTGFGRATSITIGAKGDAEGGGARIPWTLAVLGGLAAVAATAALFKSRSGVSAHGGRLVYRFGIPSVFAAGVAEILAALWVARNTQTRRAAGVKIIFVSIVIRDARAWPCARQLSLHLQELIGRGPASQHLHAFSHSVV